MASKNLLQSMAYPPPPRILAAYSLAPESPLPALPANSGGLFPFSSRFRLIARKLGVLWGAVFAVTLLSACSESPETAVENLKKAVLENSSEAPEPVVGNQDIPTLTANPQVMEAGKRLFMTHCAQCHGKNAKGSKGIPDLTDNDWLYGGEPETILTSIREGRMGIMTSNDYLGAEKIRALAHYVLSMSNRPHDTQLAQRGRELYRDEAVLRAASAKSICLPAR